MRVLAGDYADRYIGEVLLPDLETALSLPSAHVGDLKERLLDPYFSLAAIFSVYAFSRRGSDRAELSRLAELALQRTATSETISGLLRQADGSALWREFKGASAEAGRKPAVQINRGVVAGMLELAQEIFRLDGIGSITRWLVEAVMKTDRVETQFLRLVDIRGVGPKLPALLLRDIALLFDLERSIDYSDRLYLQPVDRWIRLAAPVLLADPEAEKYADWILAGKLAKAARLAGVSGARLNMGLGYFGNRYPTTVIVFQRKLMELGLQPEDRTQLV